MSVAPLQQAISDDWRIKLAMPLFLLIDWLLKQPPIAQRLFDRFRTPNNIRNILQVRWGQLGVQEAGIAFLLGWGSNGVQAADVVPHGLLTQCPVDVLHPQQVYGNPSSVDDELVELIYEPSTDEGALDAFVSIMTGGCDVGDGAWVAALTPALSSLPRCLNGCPALGKPGMMTMTRHGLACGARRAPWTASGCAAARRDPAAPAAARAVGRLRPLHPCRRPRGPLLPSTAGAAGQHHLHLPSRQAGQGVQKRGVASSTQNAAGPQLCMLCLLHWRLPEPTAACTFMLMCRRGTLPPRRRPRHGAR